MKNKKIIIVAVAAFALSAVIAFSLSFGYFHIEFMHEKVGIALPLTEDNILSGDGTEESPLMSKKPPEVINVMPRLLPWNENDESFREYRHKIYSQTQNISIAYLKEYGQQTNLEYKFIKGSPKTITYSLSGSPNGEEYIVTIDFHDKNSPNATYYVKSK